MPHRFQSTAPWLVLSVVLFPSYLAKAQVRREPARSVITQPVDNNQRVTLAGNVRPEANAKNDRGPVPDGVPMNRLQLTLRLPEEKQRELQRYLSDAQNPRSPNYRKWLTPQQFEAEFSLAPQDVQVITDWLRSEGFQVNAVSPASIDFSGTAGQVERAFKVEIHDLDVAGVRHIANMNNPEIPAALAPAVSGIVALNDFRPRPLDRANPAPK